MDTNPPRLVRPTPMNQRLFTIGLLLIIVGLIADLGVSYALPAPPPCQSTECNAALGVGLVSLLLLFVGIAVQAWALSRTRPETATSPGFQPGTTPPTLSMNPDVGRSPFPVPSPSVPPGASYSGVTAPPPPPASAPSVHCSRCGRTYGVGQFAYCPACGNPLPFAP